MSEKLIKCEVCGKEIAKSAKTCPGCGKRNKMPIQQRLLIAIVVIFVFSIISIFILSPKQTEVVSPTSEVEKVEQTS